MVFVLQLCTVLLRRQHISTPELHRREHWYLNMRFSAANEKPSFHERCCWRANQVVELYAAPAAVAKIVVDLLPCVAAFLFADGMQMCLSGTITGAGKQGVTMPILVVSYWVLGLPLGALFALRWPELGLLGLWIGMTLAVYVHFGSYLLLCFCPCVPHAVRWEAVLEEARQRLAKEEGEGVSRTEQDQEREVPLWEKCDAVI